MHRYRRLVGFAVLVLLAALAGAGGTAGAAPVQRLQSEHFVIHYDPDRLDPTAAAAARDAAERGYAHCLQVFGKEPRTPIDCDLTPAFLGATGFAVPERQPRIGVRFPDLAYVGLNGQYVLTHEIAHIFSGKSAGGPLGEGLADFVAGGFSEMPLSPWWGGALRRRGLWVDPDGLFITGNYPASTELDARLRVARYTEPALLIQFLVGEYGFERFMRFLPAYERARMTMASNEERRGRRSRDPDPEAARASFLEGFGVSWDLLRQRWEKSMEASPPSAALAGRLVLSQQIYASIRNYEMWMIRSRVRPPRATTDAVRQAFVEANRALDGARLSEAEAHFAAAQRLIAGLRHPMLSADANFLQRAVREWRLNPGPYEPLLGSSSRSLGKRVTSLHEEKE
jgi:hypothetical protein